MLKKIDKKIILPIIEGVCVISVELIATKLLTPYYGNSLQVWSLSIFFTMLGLSLGYFAGGILIKRKLADKLILPIVFASCLFTGILPFITPWIINFSPFENLLLGYSFVMFFSVFPIIIMFASLLPISVAFYTEKHNEGKWSGLIYSLSTFSSVIFASLISYVIIEKLGVVKPLILIANFSFILFVLLLKRELKSFILVGILIFISFISYVKLTSPVDKKMFQNVYHSESMMGQLKVIDSKSNSYGEVRLLQVNGVTQTYMYNHSNYSSVWQYPHIMSSILSNKPVGSKALLIGLAGGSLAKELVSLGYFLDVVEIDKRMIEISKEYFHLDDKNIFFKRDDARHFIKTCNEKYDIIAIDILSGEIQPNHVFTLEGFKELKEMLKVDGIIAINYQSLSTEKMNPKLSIYKTIEKSGLKVKMWENELSEPRDLVFIAKKEEFIYEDFEFNRVNSCCLEAQVNRVLLPNNLKTLEYTEKQPLLTDDLPILETMNQETIKNWRKVMIDNFAQKKYQDLGYQLYK